MAFGRSVEELIHDAVTKGLLPEERHLYVPIQVIALPVGTRKQLPPVWNAPEKKYVFNGSYYGKVVMWRQDDESVQEEGQMSLF